MSIAEAIEILARARYAGTKNYPRKSRLGSNLASFLDCFQGKWLGGIDLSPRSSLVPASYAWLGGIVPWTSPDKREYPVPPVAAFTGMICTVQFPAGGLFRK